MNKQEEFELQCDRDDAAKEGAQLLWRLVLGISGFVVGFYVVTRAMLALLEVLS